MLFWAIATLIVVIDALTLVDAARRPHSRWGLVAWVLAVLVLPLVGAVAYWVLRGPAPSDAARARR
jgi:Phospholipase_D-nuclease N-terminal